MPRSRRKDFTPQPDGPVFALPTPVSPPPPPPVQDPNLEVGDKVTPLLPYGVGIDCHSQFIQVCVLVQSGGEVLRYESEFKTTWTDLQRAHAYAVTYARLAVHSLESTTLRYTIESTGTYHMPVLLCWRGIPSVVNPVLAGSTRRKTDVLDARMLAHHSLVGMWPASFIPSSQGEELRVLLGMRYEAGRNATRCLNRVGNHLLRFGHTIGREKSTADMLIRGAVDDMNRGVVPIHESICPAGLPESVRPFFAKCYELYDQFAALRIEYHKSALAYVKSRLWPTQKGDIKGGQMLDCLTSVPGVGEVSALTWLSVVCDPRRFQSQEQVAAFCGADPSLKVSAGKVTSHVRRKGQARLHHVLKNVAAQLVRRNSDPIGMWGYGIYRRTAKGGWSRAIAAVARRLSQFMWHVHRLGDTFSYEQYKFYAVQPVVDVPVEEMDLGSRYTAALKEVGVFRSTDAARAMKTTLPQQKGIGAGCLSKVRAWLNSHELTPAEAQAQAAQKRPLKEVLAANLRPSEAPWTPDSSKGASSTERSPGDHATRSQTQRRGRLKTESATASTPVAATTKSSSGSPRRTTPSTKKSRSPSTSKSSSAKATAPATTSS